MGELYKLIEESKKGNKECLLKVICRFNPLLRKYSRKLNYDGSESDLIICILEIIYTIPINNNKMQQDECIVGYINVSIKHKYIYLSKKYTNIMSRETEFNTDILEENYNQLSENSLYLENLMDNLPKLQQEIIKQIYFKGTSEKDIAKQLNISRQAVNRAKNRALKNLKNRYLS